jgi:hypothetical protein
MDSNPTSWYQDPLKISAVITAFATVAYFVTSILLWRATRAATETTRRMFEAANRPYVGIESISPNIQQGLFIISLIVRNYGNAPAYISGGTIQCFSNGTLYPSEPLGKVLTLQPNASYPLAVKLEGSKVYTDAKAWGTIEIRLNCTYKGIAKQTYNQKEEYSYDRDMHSFIMVASEGT